jgi:hypothetical protein
MCRIPPAEARAAASVLPVLRCPQLPRAGEQVTGWEMEKNENKMKGNFYYLLLFDKKEIK